MNNLPNERRAYWAAQMDEAQKAWLIDRAVAWLADNTSGQMPAEPEPARLRELMTLATGRPMPANVRQSEIKAAEADRTQVLILYLDVAACKPAIPSSPTESTRTATSISTKVNP